MTSIDPVLRARLIHSVTVQVAAQPRPTPTRAFAAAIRHGAPLDAAAALATAWRLARLRDRPIALGVRLRGAALAIGVGGLIASSGAVALASVANVAGHVVAQIAQPEPSSHPLPIAPAIAPAASPASPTPFVVEDPAPSPSADPAATPATPTASPRPTRSPRPTPRPTAPSAGDGSGSSDGGSGGHKATPHPTTAPGDGSGDGGDAGTHASPTPEPTDPPENSGAPSSDG